MTISHSKELVQFFRSCFREVIGEDYVPTWGRDIKIMSDLLKYVKKDKIKVMIKHFFARDHTEKSYGIRWFKVVFNDILAAHIDVASKKMTNPDVDRY